MRRILSVWGGERKRRTFIPRIQQLTQTFLSWMDRLINVSPMLFWMQAQICKENGGIVTQLCAFIHLGLVESEFWGEFCFQENRFNWVLIVRESTCLSLITCHCLQKVVVVPEKLPFSPCSQKPWVNNRKLHKQVLRLSVCLLGPYLAFKSVERSHPGGEEIRAAVVGL